MLTVVHQVAEQVDASLRQVCREVAVPYSSLMRWQRRQAEGKATVGRPGPAKLMPLELATLQDAIRGLDHGRERTRGTGALHSQYAQSISRRDFQTLVAAVRQEVAESAAAALRRIEWLAPGWVWSMDDAELNRLPTGKGHVHVVHDLGSRYTLGATGTPPLLPGEEVAENLRRLFREHGAPLFLKADHGGNLNHHAVLAALAEHWVILLNSPAYYPPYNGAIEHKQREIQERLTARYGQTRMDPFTFEQVLALTGHELNHQPRPCLGGRISCQVLQESRPAVRGFGRRQRKEAFDEIKLMAIDIAGELTDHTAAAADTAFRHAAETWMQRNNIINVVRNPEVSPCYL